MKRFNEVIKSIEWHLGWQDPDGQSVSFQVWYHLNVGVSGRREIQLSWSSLEPAVRTRLTQLVDWCLRQYPKPNSYTVLGQKIEPRIALDVLHFPVFGQSEQPPNVLYVSAVEYHPDAKKGGLGKRWS